MAIINCYDVNGDAIRFLTQWDHDISIRATGVKTSPIPEFRFSNKNSQKSKCISGVVVGDGVKVTIPNGFLQEALPIYVQLFYTYPSGDAKTEHTFVIPVKPASMPDEAVYEPVEVRSIVELEKRVKALEENGVPGAGGVPSNPSFDTVSLGGDAGVVIIPEGTAGAPAITFYGAHGDEPVALNNVADATDDRSAPNLGQVKQLVEAHSGQNSVQADLAQNDPEAPDYVKGRTHYEESIQTVIEWDGSTEGLDVVAVGSDYSLVRVSGLLPSAEMMVGRTVEMADGSSFEITANAIEQSGPVWAVLGPVGDDLLPVLYGIGVTEVYGITLPATGMYAVLYQGQAPRFARMTVAYETVHRLDPKYLPEEAVREYMIDLDYDKKVVTSSDKNVLVGRIPNDLSAADINNAYASGQRLVVRLKIGDDGVVYMRLVGCGIRNWSFEVDMGSQYTADRIQKLYLELYQSQAGSDAMTARVAYVHTVLGGDAEQVQADLGQNDPNQPDYVKNRTHWEEGDQTVIEWDGSTEGRDSIVHGESTFCKISDETPGKSELIGATMTANGETAEITDALLSEEDGAIAIIPVIVVAYKTELNLGGVSIVLPGTGIYVNSRLGALSLTYGSTIVHPLAEKWIPESIARVRQIPSDEHIKSLIDTALGVIENGTY